MILGQQEEENARVARQAILFLDASSTLRSLGNTVLKHVVTFKETDKKVVAKEATVLAEKNNPL